MDNLRLILILLGICIIAGIYICDRIQSRNAIKKRTIHSTVGLRSKTHTVFSGNDDSEENLSSEFVNLNNFLIGARSEHQYEADDSDDALHPLGATTDSEGNRVIDRQLDDSTSPSTGNTNEAGNDQHSVDISPEDIITLHIVSLNGAIFAGQDIERSLSDLGFQFGDMGIFHYSASDTRLPLVSLANMFEPGSFDIEAMADFSTDGLSMFVCLPTPAGAKSAFETMLDKAYDLAEKLGGEVYGPDHNPLNEHTLDSIYQRLREHD